MDTIEVAVKVGKTSHLTMANCKMYRAVSLDELEITVSKCDNIHIVIVENIESIEQEQLKQFISNYTSIGDNHVLFYIPDKDEEVTSGIADELEYEIFMTTKALYMEIERLTGVNVDTRMNWKKTSANGELVDIKEDNNGTTVADLLVDTEAVKEEKETEQVEERTEQVEHEADDNSKEQIHELTLKISSLNDEVADLNDALKVTREKLKDSRNECEKQAEKVDRLNSEIKRLDDERNSRIGADEALREKSEQAERFKAELEELNEREEELKAEAEKLRSEKEDIKSEKEELERKLAEVNSKAEKQANELEEKVKAIESEKEDLESEKEDLESEIEKLKVELEAAMSGSSEAEELHKALEEKEDKIKKAEDRIRDLEEKLSEERNNSAEQLNKINEQLEEIRELEEKASQLNESLESIEKLRAEASEEIENLNGVISGKDSEIIELKINEENLNSKIEELEDKLNNNEQVANLSKEVERLEDTVDELRSTVEEKEQKINSMVDHIGGGVEVIDSIKENNNTLVAVNKGLQEKIENLEGENGVLQSDNKKLNNSINALRESERQLRDNLKAMAGINMTDGEISVAPIKYSGNAKMIHVFGHGSYGTTTTAMSTAVKQGQNAKVIVVDMDITSPSFDQWTKKSPYVVSQPGVPKMLQTGLGVLIKKGFKAFMVSANAIGTIQSNKSGAIDYITGLYGTVPSREIAAAQFSELLNYLGEKYDYIVIDSGRIGESFLHDSLIKELCSVSYANIYVVNGSSPLQINSAMVKIKNSGITLSRVSVLLNMCTNSGISEAVKKMLSGMKYEIMHAETELVFKNAPYFTDIALTKEKFEDIMKDIL